MPEHFLCPILFTCMEDPVVTRHGYSYERHAIMRVATDPDTSKRLDPLARMPITADDLAPNRAPLTITSLIFSVSLSPSGPAKVYFVILALSSFFILPPAHRVA